MFSEIYRQRSPQQMIVCGDIRSEGLDERNHRTNLPRVIDALKGVSKTELSLPRKPPGHISAALIFSFMRGQASLTFLIVKIGPYLKSFRHVPRAAEKEIDAVGTHVVP